MATKTTPEKKALRDRRIYFKKVNGKTAAEIAAEEGLAERTVYEIVAAWQEEASTELAREDALRYVEQQIKGYEWLRARLYDLATDPDTQDSVQVSALRAIGAFRKAEIELRQQVGLLPRNLGRFSVELRLQHIGARLLAIFEKYDLPMAANTELLELFPPKKELLEQNAVNGEASGGSG